MRSQGNGQSRFNAARVPFWMLREAVKDIYGSSPDSIEATDVLLAEAVRRYVTNDRSPPGGEDQLQQFNAKDIFEAFQLKLDDAQIDEIVGTLGDRDLAAFDVPEADVKADEGCFFVTPAGVERGLAILDRLSPADPPPDPKDGDMEKLLLRYFINDDRAARGAQSLTTIFEQVGRPSGWRGAFFDELRTPDEKRALGVLLEGLAKRGLLQRRQSDNDFEPYFEANDRAIRRYFGQRTIGRGGEVDQTGHPTDALNDAPAQAARPPENPEPIRIDSRSWTGLTRVRVTHRNARAISGLIDTALSELSSNGNANTAQARTLLLAAKELTDAPDPPSDIIWELIQRAGAAVGLLDIFFRIFAAAIVVSQSAMS